MIKGNYESGMPVALITTHNEKGGLSYYENRAIRFSCG